MYIKIKLLSDLCAASGSGYAGSIDTDIVYDAKTGLPYIPSKRIKGCLREAGLDILSFGQGCENEFYKLFGRKGDADGGALKISDGRLDYDTSKVKNKFDVLDELTTLRYGTRMEAGKGLIRKVKDKSFRVARVLNKGEELFFKVEYPKEYEKFLEMCCDMLRNVGSNRTRGWGEVKCELVKEEASKPPATQLEPYSLGYDLGYGELKYTAYCASYSITLEEPVISALLSGGGGCEGYLPGSMLLGYFASRWIKNHHNKIPHNDEEFRRIFLEGKVKFGSAYPGEDKPFYPAPASIKTNKTNEIAHDDAGGDDGKDETISRKLGGFVDLAASKEDMCMRAPETIGVSFDIALHHARAYDRSVGHAGKNSDNAVDGALFSYKALSAGQRFFGTIIGSEKDLEVLEKLSQPLIRLGRSRSAQYGNAAFRWLSREESKKYLSSKSLHVPENGKVCVHIRTPLILHDEHGTIMPDAALLAKRLGLSVKQLFITETLVAGYNTKWLLPRQQMRAIQAGSVVILQNNTEAQVTIQTQQFIGLRTGEGFGHISIETAPKNGMLLKPSTVSKKPESSPASGGEDISLRIKSKQAKRDAEQKAWGDPTIRKENAPANAQLGRLLKIVRNIASEPDKPKGDAPECKIERLRTKLESEWKQDEKRKEIQHFCRLEPDQSPTEREWELYKIWLAAAVHKVRLERRGSNAS